MSDKRLMIKAIGGITAAAMVVTAVGFCTANRGVPGIVEASQSTESSNIENEEDAKDLESAITSALSSSSGNVEGTQKDETVYVFADNNGSVKETIVSDWLRNGNGDGSIADLSTLSDIENVKGEETFSQNGESVDWSANGADIYYQGKSSKEIPVGVKVTYSIDGKKMSADEVAGKSGHLVMRFDYTNNATTTVDGKETIVPFTMVTGVILSSDKFTNVTVSNGHVMSEGKNTMAIGYAFPGLSEELSVNGKGADALPANVEIEADVTDFSLDMTMTLAIPDILSEALDAQNNDELDDLKDDLEKLSDGIEDLTDGTKKLNDGALKLDEKSGDLNDGAGKISDALSTINGKLSGADVSELESASSDVNKFAKGAGDVANGTLKYMDTMNSSMDTMLGSMEKEKSEIRSTLETEVFPGQDVSKYLPGAADSQEEMNKKLTNGANAITANSQALLKATAEAQVKSTMESKKSEIEATIKSKMESLAPEIQKTIEATVKQSGATDEETIAAITKKVTDTYTEKVTKEVTEAYTKQVTEAVTKAVTENASQILVGAVMKYGVYAGRYVEADGIELQVKSSLAEAKKTDADKNGKADVDELANGAKQISEASGSIKDYTNGVNKLISSFDALAPAIEKLSSGSKDLTDGLLKYTDGVGKLHDGTKELYDGVNDMSDELSDEDLGSYMDHLERVVDSGKAYNNFSGIGKDMSGKVKFIIKTDSIG